MGTRNKSSTKSTALAPASKSKSQQESIRALIRQSSSNAQNMSLSEEEEKQMAETLAEQYDIGLVDVEEFEIPADVRGLVTQKLARTHNVVPLQKVGNTLVLAVADPSNIQALDDIKFSTKLNVQVVVSPLSALLKKIEAIYSSSFQFDEAIKDADSSTKEEKSGADEIVTQTIKGDTTEAPVIRLVNLFLLDALRKGASDIHVEPYEKRLRVRFRVDGVLQEISEPPLKYKEQIAARLKIMAGIDIAEKRLPQDGRIKIKTRKGREIDFRVSSLPAMHGEKIVLRILDANALQLDMTKLGFEPDELKKLKNAIHTPWGMCLVTGPTGSGKSTTLYSALTELNKPGTNISTAEDPVEYQLTGINQVQMHDDIGLNFASALRSFLRQDPDIIMVGEIRDYETAEIAVKASLTGHMVLSTLHTNDAPSSISRLLHMGIEPFLVTSSLTLVQAQRLVRRLCPQCKRETTIEPQKLELLGIPEKELSQYEIYEPTGCPSCSQSGYKGRVGIYEVMPFSDQLKEMVMKSATTSEIRAQAIEEGMRTLRSSALLKLKRGMTSVEEVLRSSIAD